MKDFSKLGKDKAQAIITRLKEEYIAQAGCTHCGNH